MKKLEKLLINPEELIFPCIRDLVENGLTQTRFTNDDRLPARHDITLYLAGWCNYAQISKEHCRDWLLEYCVLKLSSISKTSASGIRHSTKSTVKYIYRDNIPFICGCEDNKFKALCSEGCPIYTQMKDKYAEQQKNELQKIENSRKPMKFIPDLQPILIKDSHKAQFEEALLFIQSMIKKKTKRKTIIQLLNDRKLKTRTGRAWTGPILSSELKKLKNNHET